MLNSPWRNNRRKDYNKKKLIVLRFNNCGIPRKNNNTRIISIFMEVREDHPNMTWGMTKKIRWIKFIPNKVL